LKALAPAPTAYELVSPHARAPVLLVCDHASATIPAQLDNLGLDARSRSSHIAWDVGAAALAEQLARLLGAPLVKSGVSRLVIDANRWPGHPSAIPARSEDTIVPGNLGLTPAEAARRAEAFFWPYHRAIDGLLDRLRRRGVRPAVVSVHSFSPVYHGHARPWHVGVLWNRDGGLARELIARLAADPELEVGDNQPYDGRSPLGYTIPVHAEQAGLANALLEVRHDLIATEAGAQRWAERLAAALGDALGAMASGRAHSVC